jgi:hypothetical protein
MAESSTLFKTRMEEKNLYQTTINLTSTGKSRTGRIARDCARDRITPVGPARSRSNSRTKRPELHTHVEMYT